jgi:hypothetical protein
MMTMMKLGGREGKITSDSASTTAAWILDLEKLKHDYLLAKKTF